LINCLPILIFPDWAEKIKLMDKDENVILGPEEYKDLTPQKVVQLLIKTLCQYYQPELVNEVETRFDEFVKTEGDTSVQLLGFLNNVIKDDSKLSKILKLTHQRIIFPAYYRVKGIIYDALPFKDQRGSWNLDLIMFEDGLKVVHSKLQESKSGWPESNDSKQPRQFNFGWSLNIFLSADLTEITKLQLFVSKIELHKELDEGIVQKINQYIKEGEITDDM